jgi:hypothetical protein
MKKVLFAVLFALAATSAMAEDSFVQLQYKLQDSQDPIANMQGYNFTVGTKVLPNVTVDVANDTFMTNGNGSNYIRYEAGVTPSYTVLSGVSLFTRVATGEKYGPGYSYGYWSAEPGVKYDVNNKVSLIGSWRFRQAYSNSDSDTSRQGTVGAQYALTKTQYVGAGYSLIRGDGVQNGNIYRLTYGVKF